MKIGRLTMAAALMLAVAACDDGGANAPKLAPSADKLEPEKPKSDMAATFEVQKAGSKVTFEMEAPIEKILGKVNEAATGEVHIDLTDLTKTTGLVTVDINGLELFQRRREKEGDEFGEEKKEPKQNEHARAWLEIEEDPSADEKRKKEVQVNRTVQFSIKSVKTDTKDVTKLSGDERKVNATVTGEFLLHGHKTEKTAEVEVIFAMKDGKPATVRIKTVKPFPIGLEEHDVKPRDTIGKILDTGLSALSPKVAKEAMVSIDFTAAAKAGAAKPASAPSAAPTASATAAPAY